jgi:hypothetical protein
LSRPILTARELKGEEEEEEEEKEKERVKAVETGRTKPTRA